MNYPAVLVWATVCTLIIFFFLLSFQKADAYSLDILPHRLLDNPAVCFYDTPKPFKWHSYKAMHMWNDVLPFKIQYKHIHQPFSASTYDDNCNIHIRFVEKIWWNEESHDYRGLANCSSYGCSIQINTIDRSHGEKVRTIVHEVGHALSLGHIRPDTPQEALGLICSNNAMWEFSCTQSLPLINKVLLDAIDCIDKYDVEACHYNDLTVDDIIK